MKNRNHAPTTQSRAMARERGDQLPTASRPRPVGYREAGKVLADRIAAANGYADYDGYPILYLYRHSLELHLKAIVYHGAALLGLIAGCATFPIPLPKPPLTRPHNTPVNDSAEDCGCRTPCGFLQGCAPRRLPAG